VVANRTFSRIRTGLICFLVLSMASLLGGQMSALGAPVPSGSWTRAITLLSPEGRAGATMTFDPATASTVLFGGRNGPQVFNDTWTWNGSNWSRQAPSTTPPRLEGAATTFDEVTKQVLLFGGRGPDGKPTSDLWLWDGTTWAKSPSSPTSPAPRYEATLTYDPVTHSTVLFGGFAASGLALGDTWIWDRATWTAVTPSSAPPARGAASATFDPTNGLVVIFGGTAGAQVLGDTWTWDGSTWTQHNPSTAPAPRQDAAVASAGSGQAALLFGGASQSGSSLGDNWVWDGSRWIALGVGDGPTGRIGATLAAAPGGGLVLFGGANQAGVPFGDTWLVNPPSAAPPPSTTTLPPTTAPAPPSTTPPTRALPPSTATTTTVAPPPQPKALGVTARSVHPADLVTVSGSGFAAHSSVTITFHSTPIVVGQVQTDDQGNFSVTVSVPHNAPPGPHHFEAVGPAPAGGMTTLLATVSVTRRGHHSNWLLPIAMVALTLLLASLAGLAFTRSEGHLRPPVSP
jgi:Galactose oxidase, central domain